MKKIIYLLIILNTFFGYSQTIGPSTRQEAEKQSRLIQFNDFEVIQNRRVVVAKPCYLENGNMELSKVLITVGCSEDIFNSFGVSKLNEMIEIANSKAKEMVKNKYTYASKIIKLSSLTNPNRFHMTIEYVAQNDYGALKDGLMSVDFDSSGEFIKIFNAL